MFKLSSPWALLAIAAFAVAGSRAETHTVVFTNNCGFGTPTLVEGSTVLSTGADFTINGPLVGAVSYLQTGKCGLHGEGCTTIDVTLKNGSCTADVSDAPPHAFSVASGFGYFNGCDGAGSDCTIPGCPNGFQGLPGQPVVVGCQTANCNLAIVFCG